VSSKNKHALGYVYVSSTYEVMWKQTCDNRHTTYGDVLIQ